MKPAYFAAGLVLAAGASVATATASAADAASRPLPCRARMSNVHPKQYSTTDVLVHTAAHARVRTVAHYKTTDHPKSARANGRGNADIPYDISGATAGYRVKVSVTVHKGTRSGHCATSFTPKA